MLISGFTKEPYVECDKETYDDKVFVYMEEEAAKAKAEALKEEKIPVGAAKILSGHMLLHSLPTFILCESMHWKSIMRIRLI
ncbi:MAG: hypothetical protein ACLUD2_11735 [Clostridium sp.]